MTQAAQTAIDFGPSDRVDRWWRDVRQVMQAGFDRVGLKEMAFRMDCQPSLLADQIAERNSKALRVKQLLCLLDASAAAQRDEIVTAVIGPAGYEKPIRKKPKTESEQLRIVMGLLEKLAPGVMPLIEKELGR